MSISAHPSPATFPCFLCDIIVIKPEGGNSHFPTPTDVGGHTSSFLRSLTMLILLAIFFITVILFFLFYYSTASSTQIPKGSSRSSGSEKVHLEGDEGEEERESAEFAGENADSAAAGSEECETFRDYLDMERLSMLSRARRGDEEDSGSYNDDHSFHLDDAIQESTPVSNKQFDVEMEPLLLDSSSKLVQVVSLADIKPPASSETPEYPSCYLQMEELADDNQNPILEEVSANRFVEDESSPLPNRPTCFPASLIPSPLSTPIRKEHFNPLNFVRKTPDIVPRMMNVEFDMVGRNIEQRKLDIRELLKRIEQTKHQHKRFSEHLQNAHQQVLTDICS